MAKFIITIIQRVKPPNHFFQLKTKAKKYLVMFFIGLGLNLHIEVPSN